MKRFPLGLLAMSLIANAALIFFYFSGSHDSKTHESGAVTAAGLEGTAEAGGSGRTTASAGRAASAGAAGKVSSAIWRLLQSGDLAALKANLRAAGFPPRMVQALLSVAISEQFAERRAKLLAEGDTQPYWKAGGRGFSATTVGEFRKLWNEQQDLLKRTMGSEYSMSDDTLAYYRRVYGNLPADKVDGLQRLQSDYSELTQQIYETAGNSYLSWDRDKIVLLEKEKRADLAALLGPAELEEFERRGSSTASRLRAQLAAFDPTEAEFKAIFDKQNAFDQRFNPMLSYLADEQEQTDRREAEKQLQGDFKATLGDARYADYQRAIDPGYQAASRIAAGLQLADPAQKAADTWSLQKDVQQRLGDLQRNRDLAGEGRLQAIGSLASEANAKLTSILGPAGTTAYKQSSGGNWLRQLDTSVRTARAAATRPGGG